MSAIQVYAYVTTVVFMFLAVMLSATSNLGLFLKGLCFVLAAFGFVVCLAVAGVVVSNGIRLM